MLSFSVRSGWGIFECAARPERGDRPCGQLGRPGLWKQIGGTRSVFELPPSILAGAAADEHRFEQLAGWARATAGGETPPDWSAPMPDEVWSWLPEQALTLQVGAVALQGSLSREHGRLAVGFPIVSQLPRSLPAARREWLRTLLADGHERWRLVRVGLGRDSALAEIDLSGAPHDVLEVLVQTSLDALRHVVTLLVEPADFLVHGADCRALVVRPTGPGPNPTRKETR